MTSERNSFCPYNLNIYSINLRNWEWIWLNCSLWNGVFNSVKTILYSSLVGKQTTGVTDFCHIWVNIISAKSSTLKFTFFVDRLAVLNKFTFYGRILRLMHTNSLIVSPSGNFFHILQFQEKQVSWHELCRVNFLNKDCWDGTPLFEFFCPQTSSILQ